MDSSTSLIDDVLVMVELKKKPLPVCKDLYSAAFLHSPTVGDFYYDFFFCANSFIAHLAWQRYTTSTALPLK